MNDDRHQMNSLVRVLFIVRIRLVQNSVCGGLELVTKIEMTGHVGLQDCFNQSRLEEASVLSSEVLQDVGLWVRFE